MNVFAFFHYLGIPLVLMKSVTVIIPQQTPCCLKHLWSLLFLLLLTAGQAPSVPKILTLQGVSMTHLNNHV